MADTIRFEDQLRIEGVNFKGFGILPKYVMLDRELTLDAKTIYAYFCSFAGNGNTTFPGRDKILEELPMNKDSYYKHFHYLIEQGYISVLQQRQEGNHFSQNIYTLISNPKKFSESPVDASESMIYSRIRFSGIKSLGYGLIPKAVMVDARLPVKAKGIYAYFCSFTGSGDAAFPQIDQILFHLKISRNTYYKFYNILTDLNYITVAQRRCDSGRLSINDYYLNDNPDVAVINKSHVFIDYLPCINLPDTASESIISPCTKIPDTVSESVISPCTNLPDTKIPDTKIPDTKKQDTNINNTNINNTNINNTLYSLSHSLCKNNLTIEGDEGTSENDVQDIIKKVLEDKCVPYTICLNEAVMTEVIHFITDWNTFYPNGYSDELEQKVYNLFNQALIEMCCCTDRVMKLKGALVTYSKVIDKINELAKFESSYIDLSEITFSVMENYMKAVETNPVKNPLNYMKSCIWDVMLVGNIGFYEALRRDSVG